MSKNTEYQRKFKENQKNSGFRIRSVGLKPESIEKINKLRKDKGISFNEALDILLS